MSLTPSNLKLDPLENCAGEQYPANEEDSVDNTRHTAFKEGGMNLHAVKAFVVNSSWRRAVTCWVTLCSLTLAAQGQKTLRLEDAIYEPAIRTVLCYSLGPGPGTPSATSKLEAQNIVLEFDDLQEDRAYYYARLVHCNYDWTKSILRDLDFMRDYNEFPINTFEFSMNSAVPYVHYRFQLPTVKLPGNYVLVVYRDGDKNDLILSRRLQIYQNLITVAQEDDMAGLGNLKNTNQALNFFLNYSRIEVINPATSIHVTLRQNQRWDNARQDVRPSFIREDIKQLEYRFFDMNNTFAAGNEFRFVDFRSLNSPGINTLKLDRSVKPAQLSVALDAPRGSLAYTQYPDKNGAFVIENLDTRQEPWISANYLDVSFTLRSPKIAEEVYVIGTFNNWQRGEENRMTWEGGAYHGKLLLKQGFYDYQYWVSPNETKNGNYFEGNFFQTENVYEFFVYYRPFQPNADLLVGYYFVNVNAR